MPISNSLLASCTDCKHFLKCQEILGVKPNETSCASFEPMFEREKGNYINLVFTEQSGVKKTLRVPAECFDDFDSNEDCHKE